MTTEVWFRNPHNYIRELAEAGPARVSWDRGLCVKRRIDPIKHAEVYFPNKEWRVLLIGEQGSAEYTNSSEGKPVAVYPTWDATNEPIELLEEMMMYPLGLDDEACSDMSVPDDQRPVAGQPNRVVITNMPSATTLVGRSLARKLMELQEEYEECSLFIHGLYSFRILFGFGFRIVDIDPRTDAGKGRVTLPTGKMMFAEKTVAVPQWITLLGMKPVDLTKEPRNRCIYNIKSAMWAGENFNENVAFASRQTASAPREVDTEAKKVPVPETKAKSPFSVPVVAQPNDKINCDTCSLQNSCKYYREGSVCSVPGSEPAELAKHFKTRDADQIIDGLGTLLSLQARRLDRGVAEENLYGELDPEVTKIANQLFTNGAKLAKLVDPQRFAGPSVQVNVQQGAAAIQAATPNQIMGSIVRELEMRGIPRDQITPEMVQNLLAEMGGAQQAPRIIESSVVSRDVD